MTITETIALENDLTKLKNHFNPKYVKIYRLPNNPEKSKYSFRLKFVVHAPSYVVHSTEQTDPERVNSVTFYMDILSGYPESKPSVYYGDYEWPYHVNVFTGKGHHQCTDKWNGEDGSLCQLAEKTVRAIVFDPEVTRYDSLASTVPLPWQKGMEKNHKFPTVDVSLLLRRYQRRQPKRA